MIKLTGTAILRVPIEVILDINEDEWDNLTTTQQNALIDASVDWHVAGVNAEVDDVEVDDIENIE